MKAIMSINMQASKYLPEQSSHEYSDDNQMLQNSKYLIY